MFLCFQQPGEEQQENETDEQFEERVLNKRAAQMFVAVRSRLNKKDPIYLSEMTYKNNRKQVSVGFLLSIVSCLAQFSPGGLAECSYL